jgi:acyl-coenzyme A synthetase/AMP-(fatty) acid ligase
MGTQVPSVPILLKLLILVRLKYGHGARCRNGFFVAYLVRKPRPSSWKRWPPSESYEVHSHEHTVLHCDAADPTNRLNKTQCRSYTKRIAHGLRTRFGIGKDGPGKDVVVAISSGQVMLPTLLWGIIAAGCVYSAATSSFLPMELARQVNQGLSNLIVCSADYKDMRLRPRSSAVYADNAIEWTEDTTLQ